MSLRTDSGQKHFCIKRNMKYVKENSATPKRFVIPYMMSERLFFFMLVSQS